VFGLPTVVLGETYVKNDWQIYGKHKSDLGDINYYFMINSMKFPTWMLRFKLSNLWLFQGFINDQTHSKQSDQKDIDHHYSIGNDFYEYLLGETMTYTCAIYPSSSSTLEEAQINKVNTLVKKLNINSKTKNETILDIGCGWGQLASYIGNISTNVKVVGISLSEPQLEYARERYGKYHPNKNVEFIKQDYRDVPANSYSKIVSVGMFEHVGLVELNTFMKVAYNALHEGGIMVLHYNIMPDTWPNFLEVTRSTACKGISFVSKYVFPSACLLQSPWVVEAAYMEGFLLIHEENIGLHYVKTLKEWRNNLMKNKDNIIKAKKSYNSTLIKTYEFYLAYAETGHRAHRISKIQQIFWKPYKNHSQFIYYDDISPYIVSPYGKQSLN